MLALDAPTLRRRSLDSRPLSGQRSGSGRSGPGHVSDQPAMIRQPDQGHPLRYFRDRTPPPPVYLAKVASRVRSSASTSSLERSLSSVLTRSTNMDWPAAPAMAMEPR